MSFSGQLKKESRMLRCEAFACVRSMFRNHSAPPSQQAFRSSWVFGIWVRAKESKESRSQVDYYDDHPLFQPRPFMACGKEPTPSTPTVRVACTKGPQALAIPWNYIFLCASLLKDEWICFVIASTLNHPRNHDVQELIPW